MLVFERERERGGGLLCACADADLCHKDVNNYTRIISGAINDPVSYIRLFLAKSISFYRRVQSFQHQFTIVLNFVCQYNKLIDLSCVMGYFFLSKINIWMRIAVTRTINVTPEDNYRWEKALRVCVKSLELKPIIARFAICDSRWGVFRAPVILHYTLIQWFMVLSSFYLYSTPFPCMR